MSQHHDKVVNRTMSFEAPRSCEFDPELDKSLNDELKRLYTAITRAKSNLWIYESDHKLCLPMFDYWKKRNLVKIVQAQSTEKSEHIYKVVFASNSTPEQWKAQGDNLMKKGYFQQALHCYQQAGNGHLVKIANTYCLLQRAIKKEPSLKRQAGLECLEAAESCRSNSLETDFVTTVELLNFAALCLSDIPEHRIQAAKLFECLGKEEAAAQLYLKLDNIENFVRLKEKSGKYEEVLQTLWEKPFKRKKYVLAKAREYENADILLPQRWCTNALLYTSAKYYSERKDKRSLVEVLHYMPEVRKIVKFLKEAELFVEAFDVLIENKHFADAYRLASAQGGSRDQDSVSPESENDWLFKGLQVATDNNNEDMRASFVFQMAKMEYLHLKSKGKLKVDSLKSVKYLKSLLTSQNRLIKAQAHLLLGMLRNESDDCKSAMKIYHNEKHGIGELEAFNQLQQLNNSELHISDQLLLNLCHLAKHTSEALASSTDFSKEFKDAISFYGMQMIGCYHYMPPMHLDIWNKKLQERCVCRDNKVDVDGMIRLEGHKVKSELVQHCQMFKTTWLARHKLKRRLEQELTSMPLHEQVWEAQHLQCLCPDGKACAENMQKYLQTSIYLIELQCLNKSDQQDLLHSISMLTALFTPRLSIYVTKSHSVFTPKHIATLRQSTSSITCLQEYISDSILTSSVQYADVVELEPWIMAWRVCCISDPDMKVLFEILLTLENLVNATSSTPSPYQSLPGFIYWRSNRQYYHIFSIWLNSCSELREHGKPLWAARLAIKHFIGNIDVTRNVASTLDVVYLLSVHCTGLLAILAHVYALWNYSVNFTVPLLYEKIVNLFDIMNTGKEEHCQLLTACAENVRKRKNYYKVFDDCCDLLLSATNILLGTKRKSGYLDICLKEYPSANYTQHCLILVLVLLGNLHSIRTLTLHDQIHERIFRCFGRFRFLIRSCFESVEKPQFMLKIDAAMKSDGGHFNQSKFFMLVYELLDDAKMDSTLATIAYNAESTFVKIEPLGNEGTSSAISASLHSPVNPRLDSGEREQSNQPNVNHGQIQSMGSAHPVLPTNMPHHAAVSSMVSTQPLPQHGMWQHVQPPFVPRPHLNVLPPTLPLISHSGYIRPPVVLHQHNETLTERNTEPEDAEEEEILLTAGLKSEPSIDPDVIDSEGIIVTDNYCNACLVELIRYSREQHDSSEDYYLHLNGEIHREKFFQCQIFSSKKSDRGSYNQILQKLNELKERCLETKRQYDTDELDQTIGDIEEETEKNANAISSYEYNGTWREGNKAISLMEDSMNQLLKHSEEFHMKLAQDLKTRHVEDNETTDHDDILAEGLKELQQRTEECNPIDDPMQ